jgi:RHS repeat-associated protein
MMTDSSTSANIIVRHEYPPFGEEIPANTAGRRAEWGPFSDKVNQKFTGQERDEETGFDFFQARYFCGAQGRFNSPDPGNAGANVYNPQSWNGYSYVLNNPLSLVDPTGTVGCTPTDGADFCEEHDEPTPSDPWSRGGSLFQLWWNSLPQMQQQAQHVAQQAFNWVTAPRDSSCVQGAAVAGAAIGGTGGAIAGGIGGGAAGGIVGSVIPVAVNVAGAAGGRELGAARALR